MQSSQELILLKEVMLSASQRRHIDFNSENNEFSCKIVKEISNDVDEILKLDGKTDFERDEAQKSMHSALFHKTLQTCGELEDPDGYYEHVCSSLPDVGWSFYVSTVVICGWHRYTSHCLQALSSNSVVRIVERIVENVHRFDCMNAVCLFCAVLSHVVSMAANVVYVEHAQRLTAIVERAIELERVITLETRTAEMFLSLLRQLCGVLYRPNGLESWSRIEKIFCLIVEVSCDRIEFLNFADPESGFRECYHAVRHVYEGHLKEMDGDVVRKTKQWIEMTQRSNLADNWKEDRIMMDIRAVDSGSEFITECIDRLIGHLVVKEHSGISKCFLDNYTKLGQSHVARLLRIDGSRFTDHGLEIQTICSKTFCSWNLDNQDAFRGGFHETCSLEDCPPLTERSLQDLTIVFNRLSSGVVVDDETISDISLACLKFPIDTVHKLMEHAVKNGQFISVVKILVHLKGTCNATVLSRKESLLVLVLRPFVVVDDIEPKYFDNYTALIKELLKIDVLDLVEFVKKALLRNLTLSPYCWRVLSVLKVLLASSTDDQLRCIFGTLSVSIVLLLVGQVVDDCMCRYLGFPFETVEWDVLNLKSEAIGALCIASSVIQRREFLRDALDLVWLREKLDNLHPVIEFHLQDILYGQSDREYCFEGMPLHHLLLIGCSSTASYDAVVAHLITYVADLFPDGFGNAIVVVLIKILARLTAVELQTVMRLLVTFYSLSEQRSSKCADAQSHDALSTVVANVVDAFLALFPSNSAAQTHPHMIRVVQNFTTALKILIDAVEGLTNEIFVQVIFHVVRMIRGLCDACQTAPKLLILSLVKEIVADPSKGCRRFDEVQCAALASIVGNVNNDELFVRRVKQLLGLD